jgi:DNA-binding PadR family transcriptional regulator
MTLPEPSARANLTWEELPPPLSLPERIAYGDTDPDWAMEAAHIVTAECRVAGDPYTDVPRALRHWRTSDVIEVHREAARRVGLTAKQADILSTFLVCGQDLSLDDIQADVARSAGAGGWVGWDKGSLGVTLKRLMARGLACRREVQRIKLRDPKWLWSITNAGVDLNQRYLDAWDDVNEERRLASS